MMKLRFGVMGCASIARRMVLPAMNSLESVELVAIASRSADKAVAFSDEFGARAVTGYEELLGQSDIDAIYMPLPTGLHLEWGLRALEAGKHVFFEKSLGMNLAEANAIVDAALKYDRVVKENYMFAYHRQQEAVRTLMAEKAGNIRLFRASFGFPPLPLDNFRYQPEVGGGALLDAGGYVLKALSVFFPEYQPTVRASTLTMGPSGVDVAGAAMVTLERDGERIPAHLAFGFDHHYQCGVEIWGSKAKISTNRSFTAGPEFAPNLIVESAEGTEKISITPDNHFANIISSFQDAVTKNKVKKECEELLLQAGLQQSLRDQAILG